MTDGITLSLAKEIEADRLARKGYRLTDAGPVRMSQAELAEYASTGRAPARRATTAAERVAMTRSGG